MPCYRRDMISTPSLHIPEAARERILADLDRIARKENVRILFAVESGSRAWGFPSPDSDYDARFVYVRPLDWYVSLEPGRDVIELPIDGDFDTNGWDIRKALLLLLKPNPVLLEWLSSPIRYCWNDEACARLLAFAETTAFARACLSHYLSLGRRLWSAYVEGRESVNLKRYLYILRPAFCIAWIREQGDTIPPMSVPDLMNGLALASGFKADVSDLLARKAVTSELGDGPRLPALERFIQREWEWALTQDTRVRADPRLRAEAEAIFRSFVRGE